MIRTYNALRRNLRLWLILPVLFAGMAGPAGAQTKGHKVVGTVMGPDSLPLQGATVIIKEVNRGAVSDSKGRYVLSGTYRRPQVSCSLFWAWCRRKFP